MHHAARDVGNFPQLGRRAGHADGAGRTEQIRRDQRIMRIHQRDAVGLEGVAVAVGLERRRGDAPEALVVLGQSDLFRALARQEDLFCIGRLKAEGHAVIGMNLRGNDRRRGLRQKSHGGNSK